MRHINHYFLLSNILLLLTLPGCNFFNYNNLKRVPHFYNQRTLSHTKTNVNVCVHPLDNKEAEKYFSRNIIADGYFPFHLHIENHTNQPYVIEPSYITLHLTNPSKIAKLLHYNTSTHMWYSNILAFLFAWPLIPFVIIPTGLSMAKMNKKITKNISRNSIGPRERLKIPPYARIDRFFFVHEADFESRFVIKLCEKSPEHRLLRYEIDLTSHNSVTL